MPAKAGRNSNNYAMMNEELALQFNKEAEGLSIPETIRMLCNRLSGPVVFSTSFSYEDQVVTDIIFTADLPVSLFTLDTGRHFEETYKVMNRTREHYGKDILTMFPDREQVENLLSEKGPYSFYESIENRKECCHIRKVLPLRRALAGASCWITGLRAGQSETRQNLEKLQYDPSNNLIKYHPLLDWTLDLVKDYVKENHIPYNLLHDKDYPSIGCAPCTRAIGPDEPFRAGRWWWENNSSKECGLHPSEEK